MARKDCNDVSRAAGKYRRRSSEEMAGGRVTSGPFADIVWSVSRGERISQRRRNGPISGARHEALPTVDLPWPGQPGSQNWLGGRGLDSRTPHIQKYRRAGDVIRRSADRGGKSSAVLAEGFTAVGLASTARRRAGPAWSRRVRELRGSSLSCRRGERRHPGRTGCRTCGLCKATTRASRSQRLGTNHLGKLDRIERLLPMDAQMQDMDLGDGGRPVQVVLAHPDHTFELDEAALSEILLHDDVKDRNVVVVSVAGAFRKGKSFLLDFFLRYMNNKYTLQNDTDSWLGAEDEPLSGFPWRGGSERDTTGILMWSKVYPATLANGEKIAVILMDTQGAFDSESTMRDCATVFALSTMLSSVQIYNLSQNIQEDDLQHLQLFTEYGRLALESSESTPFQKLQFLVRDWVYPYEYDYGANGGKKLLDKRLEISDRQPPELQSLRKHIMSCFSDISCFLMPHPGLEIATNPRFDGRLSEIQAEFKKQLKVFIPMILAPENLVTKKINGQVVKAKDLLEYLKSYINLYNGDELPEPRSVLMATAEANNVTAVAEAKDLYLQMMNSVCGGAKPFLATAQLESEHQRCMDTALRQFQNKRKMGGEEFSQTYMEKLIKHMDNTFSQFKAHNESKLIKRAQTLSQQTVFLARMASTVALTTAVAVCTPYVAPIAVVVNTVCVTSMVMCTNLWSYALNVFQRRE